MIDTRRPTAALAPVRHLGVTLLAALLIATPLVQWMYISMLSYFTILEPPLTASRGVPLAMQLFFSPGNIVPVALGVGLLLRSEWTRRVARGVFVLAVALTGWFLGIQVANSQLDSSALLAMLSLAICGTCLWYFGLKRVREEFRPAGTTKGKVAAKPASATGPLTLPRGLAVAAYVEIVVGVAAAFLMAALYVQFDTRSLIDLGPGTGVTGADELLRKFLLAVFVLFLAPFLLTTYASIGMLLGRDTRRVARRYALIACWTVVGAALFSAWLITREGLVFDLATAGYVFAFSAVSLAWHVWFVTLIARSSR